MARDKKGGEYGYIHIYINGFCHCRRFPRQLAIYKIWKKVVRKAIRFTKIWNT